MSHTPIPAADGAAGARFLCEQVPPVPDSASLVVLDEVDSTNDALRRWLADDSNVTQAVLAYQQTKGRGRLGRTWASPPGGVYFSVALDITAAGSAGASLSLVVALALVQALAPTESLAPTEALVPTEALTGTAGSKGNHTINGQAAALADITPQISDGVRDATVGMKLGIKWPNDLITPTGKLAGILIESVQVAAGTGSERVAAGAESERIALVGVGINVCRPTSGAFEGAAYLSDFMSEKPDPHQTALDCLRSIREHYGQWQQQAYGFAGFQQRYHALLAGKGTVARVSNAQGRLLAQGSIQGVNDAGMLLLVDGQGRINAVSAGEVTLREG